MLHNDATLSIALMALCGLLIGCLLIALETMTEHTRRKIMAALTMSPAACYFLHGESHDA